MLETAYATVLDNTDLSEQLGVPRISIAPLEKKLMAARCFYNEDYSSLQRIIQTAQFKGHEHLEVVPLEYQEDPSRYRVRLGIPKTGITAEVTLTEACLHKFSLG